MNEVNTTINTTIATAHKTAVAAADIKPVAKSTDRALAKIKAGIERREVMLGVISDQNKKVGSLNADAAKIMEADVVRPHKVAEIKASAVEVTSAYKTAKKAFKPLNDLTAKYAAVKGKNRTPIAREIEKALQAIDAAAAIASKAAEAAAEAFPLITAEKTVAEKRAEVAEEIATAVKGKTAEEFFAEYGKKNFAVFPKKADFEAALGVEALGAYNKMNGIAGGLLIASIKYRAAYETAATVKTSEAEAAMNVAKDDAFDALKEMCSLFGLKNGITIGYNDATIGALASKSYRFVPKDDVAEGYIAVAKSSLSFMKEALKELCAAGSIAEAAKAAEAKAAALKAKREARAAKKAAKKS